MVPWIYNGETTRTLKQWRGHRLLGIDSSLLGLPNSAELLKQFSVVEVTNQSGSTGTRYPEARMSVLYDLLNRVGLDGRLEPSSLGEVDLAIEQLSKARAGDVLINDRGFTGYRYLAWHHRLGLHHISRCSTASFGAAQEMFRMNRAGRSKVVRLMARPEERLVRTAVFQSANQVVAYLLQQAADGIDAAYQPKPGWQHKGRAPLTLHCIFGFFHPGARLLLSSRQAAGTLSGRCGFGAGGELHPGPGPAGVLGGSR